MPLAGGGGGGSGQGACDGEELLPLQAAAHHGDSRRRSRCGAAACCGALCGVGGAAALLRRCSLPPLPPGPRGQLPRRALGHTSLLVADAPGGWVYHEGLNCVNGQGGEVLGDGQDEIGGLSLSECMRLCAGKEVCEGVLVMHGEDPHGCWLRRNLDPGGCLTNTPWDLWQRDPGREPDRQRPEAPHGWGQSIYMPLGIPSDWPAPFKDSLFEDAEPDSLEQAATSAESSASAEPSAVVQSSFSSTSSVNTSSASSFSSTSSASTTSATSLSSTSPASTRSPSSKQRPSTSAEAAAPRKPPAAARTSAPSTDATSGGSPSSTSEQQPAQTTSGRPNECNDWCAWKEEEWWSKCYWPDCATCWECGEYGPSVDQVDEGSSPTAGTSRDPLQGDRGAVLAGGLKIADWPGVPCATAAAGAGGDKGGDGRGEEPCEVAPAAAGRCPLECDPAAMSPPAVVIPFYERDLCKMKYTARSLSVHDTGGYLGEVLLMWVSWQPAEEYRAEIDELQGIIGQSREVSLLDFSSLMSGSQMSGWFAQQVMKLKVASLVKSEFYIVLDAKNTLVQDIQAHTFMDGCRARIFGRYVFSEIPELHRNWFEASARKLGLAIPTEGYWPTSITPMTMHTETVLELLSYIGESAETDQLCNGPLCGLLFQNVTEFTSYLVWVRSNKSRFGGNDGDCVHSVDHVPWKSEVSVALWRGIGQKNVEECRAIASGKKQVAMFGAQSESLDELPADARDQALADMIQIFKDAGLLEEWDSSAESFASCLVGSAGG